MIRRILRRLQRDVHAIREAAGMLWRNARRRAHHSERASGGQMSRYMRVVAHTMQSLLFPQRLARLHGLEVKVARAIQFAQLEFAHERLPASQAPQ